MFAAIHSPTVYQSPVGVWWYDAADDAPRSYYLPGNEALETEGKDTMGGVQSAAQFETWATRMAGRTPYDDNWETIDLNPTLGPDELLRLLAHSGAA